MKGAVLALGQNGGRAVAALMVDGRLMDLALEVDGFGPGAILRGRVGRPVKGLGGVFVDLPDGARGFLRAPQGLAPGSAVLVQVAGVPEAGKAIPLTQRLMVKGRYVILTPGAPGLNVSRQIGDEGVRAALGAVAAAGMAGADPDLGLILRTACDGADEGDIAGELGDLRALAEAIAADAKGAPELLLDPPTPADLAWRDWPDPDQVQDGADALDTSGARDAILDLLSPDVPLPDGASMVIEPTRALVAVDVNTGGDTSPAAALKAALAAVRDLPRQLRLRGLGGAVVIDAGPVAKRDRQVVDQVLAKAFRPEQDAVAVAGWTALGHIELTRRRDRVPLAGWWQE